MDFILLKIIYLKTMSQVIRLKTYVQPSALQVAMNYRCVTQQNLSKSVGGISQASISKFLNGNIFAIPEDKLKEIMAFLDFPFEFLYNEFKPLKTSLDL